MPLPVIVNTSWTELPAWVEVGATFTWKYTPDNPHHGRKFHVRGIVDGRAVLAEWWKHKRRWNYTVEPPAYFSAFGAVIVPKPAPRQREQQRRKQAA